MLIALQVDIQAPPDVALVAVAEPAVHATDSLDSSPQIQYPEAAMLEGIASLSAASVIPETLAPAVLLSFAQSAGFASMSHRVLMVKPANRIESEQSFLTVVNETSFQDTFTTKFCVACLENSLFLAPNAKLSHKREFKPVGL